MHRGCRRGDCRRIRGDAGEGQQLGHGSGKVGAERFIADLAATLAKHRAIGPADLDAVAPMQRVVDMPTAVIGPVVERPAAPALDAVGIEVDLAPERLVRRHMIAEGDVPAVAHEMDEARIGEEKIEEGQDVAGLAQLPAPGPGSDAIVGGEVGGEARIDQPCQIGGRRIGGRPQAGEVGIMALDEMLDQADERQCVQRFVDRGPHEDPLAGERAGQQAAAGMRLVEDDQRRRQGGVAPAQIRQEGRDHQAPESPTPRRTGVTA